MPKDRAESAYRFRVEAAEKARHRHHPVHEANPDEARYSAACYPMSFTKGLEHSEATGLVADASHFQAFRSAIDNAFIEPFTSRVPVPREKKRRKWEAPTAGVVHDLQGPDCQAVTMTPAPELCSDELTFEMAEVYELALLRDKPFHLFDKKGGKDAKHIDAAIERLNHLAYAQDGFEGRPRLNEDGQLTRQNVFRGSSPGVDNGPYISQLMLIGNVDQGATTSPEQGYITYGGQVIDQRVLEADVNDDYMMKWLDWLHVQKGYVPGPGAGQKFTSKKRRFIYTPRDLATYVHFDALYQAYLNACLILLGNGTPFDPSFDLLSGSDDHKLMINAASGDSVDVNAGGFALYGGPHILSLVTEVATRGLKAVRYQKFNNHLRLRPEALAGRLEKAEDIDAAHPSLCCAFTKMRHDLAKTIAAVIHCNENHPNGGESTALLPMAFAEGSPMHPTYGAGHATVAGACVTMLKAFFDTSAVFAKVDGVAGFYGKNQIDAAEKVEYGAYEVVENGKKLRWEDYDVDCKPGEDGKPADHSGCCPLTLEGELNKLCANISIGRNMAGVHYFSDYYDSARMGEEIAVGILEEQALGYPTDPFVMSLPTFDGDAKRIGER
ncbi:MAG: vanadium-dependent haloperoxidase [Pseudomonadota bacterium]